MIQTPCVCLISVTPGTGLALLFHIVYIYVTVFMYSHSFNDLLLHTQPVPAEHRYKPQGTVQWEHLSVPFKISADE